MKVAFITNFCTHYRYKLFRMLSEKHGFDFFFFDDKNKTKEDIRHLKVYREERFNYMSVCEIFKNLLVKKYDVIIKCTNNKWSFFLSFLASRLTKARFIVWHTIWYYPDTLQYKLFSWFLIKILKDWSDAIVVYGEHGKRFLMEKGINPEKIFIAWQTVDNELYGRKVLDDEVKAIKEKWFIPEDKRIILYVGRFIEQKGIEFLLDALNLLDKEKFIFIAVGDGNMKGYIEDYCRRHNINLRLPGIVPPESLPPFYRIADVLVLPSITTKSFKEPWGLVVNEAFNQGCPVVVTDAVGAGVGGLVKNGINGFVVPERNHEALADAIRKIIENPQLRKELGQNAIQEIKLWTYERQAKGFLDAVEYSTRRMP